jgi:tyrosyl-tRNA synthetase
MPLRSKIDATPREQLEALKRGTDSIVSEEELLERLEKSQREGVPLKVKLGLDPTAPDIHLGTAVVLRKLRQFQDFGHEVVVIIGDFTAMIGDPSGKSEVRRQLSPEEVKANARTYEEQYTKILDPERTKVVFNSEWLWPMNFYDVVHLAAKATVARVLERDDFQKRLREGRPLGVHEILYPLCQAYDSVVLRADVEMGGTDQRFNILMGRDLQREYGQPPQVALFMPILPGLDGVQKMSKSLGNYVGISEPPDQQFGKLMSISDDLMPMYFELCTDIPMDEVRRLLAGHPMEAKKRLAREVVRMYHGAEAAERAQEEFERVHSQRALPEEIPDLLVPESALKDGKLWIVRAVALLIGSGTGEARRLIQGGGVSLNGQRVTDVDMEFPLTGGEILQVGRRQFARLKRG